MWCLQTLSHKNLWLSTSQVDARVQSANEKIWYRMGAIYVREPWDWGYNGASEADLHGSIGQKSLFS